MATPKRNDKRPPIGDVHVAKARLRAPERRAQVLDAARQVFLEAGMSNARTRDVAERAGITEAFMFRIFESKEQIYREAVEVPVSQAMEQLERDALAVAAQDIDSVELLERVIELILLTYTGIAPLAGLALYADILRGRQFFDQAMRSHFRSVYDVVADANGWNDSDLDPEIIMRTFLGVQLGTVLDNTLRGKPCDTRDLARRLTALFVNGVEGMMSSTGAR